jgi:hypothetical protein
LARKCARRLKEGLSETVNGTLAATEEASEEQSSANDGDGRKRVAPQLPRSTPGLRSSDFGQMRALSNGLATKIADMVGKVVGVLPGLPCQSRAKATDVAPHSVQLLFQAMGTTGLQAKLSEKAVEGHGVSPSLPVNERPAMAVPRP